MLYSLYSELSITGTDQRTTLPPTTPVRVWSTWISCTQLSDLQLSLCHNICLYKLTQTKFSFDKIHSVKFTSNISIFFSQSFYFIWSVKHKIFNLGWSRNEKMICGKQATEWYLKPSNLATFCYYRPFSLSCKIELSTTTVSASANCPSSVSSGSSLSSLRENVLLASLSQSNEAGPWK